MHALIYVLYVANTGRTSALKAIEMASVHKLALLPGLSTVQFLYILN